MFFNKKKKKQSCPECDAKIEVKFQFCPECGTSLINPVNEERSFGMLGRSDEIQQTQPSHTFGLGITDKMIGSLFNTLAKSLEKELSDIEENGEIQELPNGIRIQFGAHPMQKAKQQAPKKRPGITKEQLTRMAKLPRAEAKRKVVRLNNKVIYELSTPGIKDIKDIIMSRTESGYEIKIITDKKVYTNTLPLNLPIRQVGIKDNKTYVEFVENQ